MRLFCLFLLFSIVSNAQIDSALTVPLVGVNIGGQLPSGDLASRFGPNLRAGGSFLIKTKGNWIYGIDAFYFFGRNVKEDVLKQLKTPEGRITDNEGYPADIRVTERGLASHLVFGRLFNLKGLINPNSGFVFWFGAGYLQHKVNIYDAQHKVAAVNGNLRNGYDRLTGGLSLTEFIGYMYLSQNRLLNFYLGIEAAQAFTHSFRKLNYDTGLPDIAKRFDALTGLRIGWILPLYKKKPNEFYYN
jgi:hypothetical protein